jgi:hypothetical protein
VEILLLVVENEKDAELIAEDIAKCEEAKTLRMMSLLIICQQSL